MIKLRLVRFDRRPGASPQSGTDQSIYRVLCIAMMTDDAQPQEEERAPLYTAANVARFGFDSVELRDLFLEHKSGLYQWARSKGLHDFSDNIDKKGEPKRPASWTRENWQDRVADLLWNSAADICDEACDMHDEDGQPGDTYWYSLTRGVYRVPPAEYRSNLAAIRSIHAVMAEARSMGQEITEDQAVAAIKCKKGNRHQSAPENEERRPWPIRQISRRFRLWMLAAMVAAVACGAPPVRDAFGVMVEEGIQAAQKFVYSFTPRTSEELFQQAWVDYRSGNYEKATRKAYSILAEDEIKDHLRANCWYLLGYVSWETGESEAALGFFRKAYPVYEAHPDLQNLYQVTLALSKTYLNLGDLETAEEMLQLAMNHYKVDGGKYIPNLGEFYATAIDLAAAQNDIEASFQLAKKRFEIYKGGEQLDLLAEALSDLGFWYAAVGCDDNAQHYTLQAEDVNFKLQDETRHTYNKINWLLIHRLQGHTCSTQAVGNIQQWAKIRKDSRAEFFLNLALSIDPLKEYADEYCFENLVPE